MIDHVWQYFSHQVLTNQFFSGAALTGVLLGIAAYLRGWLQRAWAMGTRRLVVSFTVHSEDQLYVPLAEWLKVNNFDRFARSYRIRTAMQNGSSNGPPSVEPSGSSGGDLTVKATFGPDYGRYFFRYAGKWIRVNVAKEGDANGQGSSSNAQTREFLTISYLSLRRDLVDQIIGEVTEQILSQRVTTLSVRRATMHGWEWSGELARRHHDVCPVVLADGQLQNMIEDVEEFFDRRAWYHDRGIPWRRGYLLHGPPGTGKTSVCRYLAQHFGLTIHIVDATAYHSSNLAGMLRSVPPRSLVLFEDIDCHVPGRLQDGSPAPPPANADIMPVNIGTLLNAIDGICPPEQVLIIMTTNHISKLDPALIRPGRVDRQYYLGPCTRRHACKLFAKFFPEADPRAAAAFEAVVPDGELTPADLQGIFIAAQDADEAITAVVARAGAPTAGAPA